MNFKDYCLTFKEKILKRHYEKLHKKCNLENPVLFTDKLEWLKLHDSTMLKAYCADKIMVRNYVKRKLGNDLMIPILNVYDDFDDIDFSKLPKDYVIKTNHGSHTNIIVRDGKINIDHARRCFANWMSKDWSWYGYELHYVPIKRKIFIEQFQSGQGTDLTDYKFLCFNGEPKYVQVISDRSNTKKRLNYYDMNWQFQKNISRLDFMNNPNMLDEKPKTFELMKEYAKKLSEDFKFVRVDFYEIDGKLYVGELTFIPAAAYIIWSNPNIDKMFGDMLKL